jgi:hypothetical protein
MPGLRVLDISGSQRTDSGMWAATVTDQGLEAIATLANLTELRARNAKFTDTGIGKIGVLKGLRVLDVSDTQLSTVGLKVLEQLTRLEQLALFKCKRVDDSIVPVLTNLPALTWVDLKDTAVTAAGVAQLREKRPKLQIVWQPPS